MKEAIKDVGDAAKGIFQQGKSEGKVSLLSVLNWRCKSSSYVLNNVTLFPSEMQEYRKEAVSSWYIDMSEPWLMQCISSISGRSNQEQRCVKLQSRHPLPILIYTSNSNTVSGGNKKD